VIGSDLYQIVKSFSFDYDNYYYFEAVQNEYLTDFNQHKHKSYPIYSLTAKNNNYYYGKTSNPLKCTSKTVVAAPLETAIVDIKKQQQYQKNSTNIMVVDDEPDSVFTYKSILSYEGYTVEGFTDSMEALKHFAKMKPSYYNLVVMDIRMPGLNGLQLYYGLRAMNTFTKVVFVSALDIKEELATVLPPTQNNDNNNFIRKPIQREYLINKIRAILA
jgi:CheY-like chemotaxis protein